MSGGLRSSQLLAVAGKPKIISDRACLVSIVEMGFLLSV